MAGILIGALATALIGGIGFLLKRLITGERSKEQVSELSTLAAAAAQMRAAGVSVEEIEALKTYLRTGRSVQDALPAVVPDNGGPITQLEINEAAAEALRDLEAELARTLDQIVAYLSEDEIQELRIAQAKWDDFKRAHAEFVSRLFEGGSMRPLWFITTIEIATRDRINELQAYLETRRDSPDWEANLRLGASVASRSP